MSPIFRPWFAGSLAVLAIAIAWWAIKKDPDEPAAPAVVEEQVQVPVQQPAPRPAVGVSPQASNAGLPAKQEHDEQGERRQLVAIHEAAWAREPSSPQAAVQLEDKFRTAASSEGVASVRFPPRSVSVQCRASMCRIESEFPTSGTSSEWALRMQLALGGRVLGTVVTVPESLPDGSEKLLMYAYTPGRRPPG